MQENSPKSVFHILTGVARLRPEQGSDFVKLDLNDMRRLLKAQQYQTGGKWYKKLDKKPLQMCAHWNRNSEMITL